MPCPASLDQWRSTLRQHLPELSKPQATGWALWSMGMVRARSCALSAVSAMLATGMGRQEHTRRQRLRAWYGDASAKRGVQRQALPVETCCAPLLGGIVSGWPGTQLAVAVEATTLGDRLVVLAVRVVYRGGALPVAGGSRPASSTPGGASGGACCGGGGAWCPGPGRSSAWRTAGWMRRGGFGAS
jgi:hypothetical protein